VSLATTRPDRARLRDLTIATLPPADEASQARDRAARRGDVALSLLLLAMVGAVWTIFSG
jgi:hypothetical protein